MTVLQEFTFEAESILEGAIRNAEDRARRYTLETSKSEHARADDDSRKSRAPLCVVLSPRWRSVERVPVQREILEVARGEEYQLKYSNSADAWTVRRVSDANGTVLAELKSSISPIFGQTSLPLLRISPTVRSEEERLFFLLVLVYSETKRLDRQG
ncbi:unnamed protein product [Mycena citricolor]|uniref:Uncharacterized protein n=1 Tax=Mycena citricolor TaxID=2018698 RepID=A0AAD2K8L9_9AGAR|nr:unnamed protein product [Mycena citricolor]